MEKTIYCKKCHAEVDKNMKKCPNCGRKVGGGKLKWIVLALAFIIVIVIAASQGDNSGTVETTQPVNTETSSDTSNQKSSEEADTSTVAGIFSAMQKNDSIPFTITDKAMDMLKANPDLFTENKNVNLNAYTDLSLEYKMINKNINNYGDYLINAEGLYVIKIDETTVGDKTYSELQLNDYEGNVYYVIGLTSYNDIYDGDTVSIYALPLGTTSYENVGGGTTNAIVFAGAFIQKLDY